MTEENELVERMFPAPVDPGIAEADRAVTTVRSGTNTTAEQEANEVWYHGGGQKGEKAWKNIVIYPPTRGMVTQGDPFEPAKIGVLVDMDIGQLLADWLDPTILAIEDAMNEGVYDRPVQLIVADARGLPRENFKKVRDGYEWLCDQGCVVILGPMISDNSLNIQDLVNERKVPVIGWTGAWRFASEYCFTVANGDIPTEGVMCAQWLAVEGLQERRPVLGAGLLGRRLRRVLPRGSRSSRAHDHP